MNGLEVVFVVLAAAAALVALVRCLEAEHREWVADRAALRSLDRRADMVEFPPAVTGLRPAPRPYDWSAEPVELRPVRAHARGGAA